MDSHENLLDAAARRAKDYQRGITGRRVTPSPSAINALRELDTPLPDGSCPAADVLAILDGLGSPATVATSGGRYFGFVNGGVLPAALAASWLVSTWDQNLSLRVMSPDGLPIYDQSRGFPGAFVASCHSGVTLAAAHAERYAQHVLDGALPAELARFTGARFAAAKAA